MNNELIEWSKNNLSENSLILFNESIICYNVGAYKSAFLMSYLAFKQTIRERVLSFNQCPNGLTTSDWNTVLEELKNDDRWESSLNSYIEANPNKPNSIIIFKYRSDSDRDKILIRYKYWKNIRNCCAHAKGEHINNSTIEQFWNYLQDDLCEFYVLGGKTYLVNELCSIYNDRIIEECQKSLPKILNDISLIYKNEIYNCYDEFFKKVKLQFIKMEKHDKLFWDKIIFNENFNIKSDFVKILMKDTYSFINFYGYYREVLTIAYDIDKTFIKDNINEWLLIERPLEEPDNTRYWNLFCDLLCKPLNLVNVEKITKYNAPRYVNNLRFSEMQYSILRQYDIFNKFLLGAFSYIFKVEFEDIKNHAFNDESDAILWFSYVTWNKEVVEMFLYSCKRLLTRISELNGSYYGSWERDRLAKYKEVAKSCLIDILWYYYESKTAFPNILLDLIL